MALVTEPSGTRRGGEAFACNNPPFRLIKPPHPKVTLWADAVALAKLASDREAAEPELGLEVRHGRPYTGQIVETGSEVDHLRTRDRRLPRQFASKALRCIAR